MVTTPYRKSARLMSRLNSRIELAVLLVVALSPILAIAQVREKIDRGVVALPKNTDSGMWLLVVNEWTDPLTYTLPLGEEHEGKRYTDPAAGVAATVKDGVLTLPIGPQSVHVLRPE